MLTSVLGVIDWGQKSFHLMNLFGWVYWLSSLTCHFWSSLSVVKIIGESNIKYIKCVYSKFFKCSASVRKLKVIGCTLSSRSGVN